MNATRRGLLGDVVGRYVPSPCPTAPNVEIVYRRPPDRVTRHTQELLYDGEEVKVTLLLHPAGGPPLPMGGVGELPGGASLLWFTFPGRELEIAALYDAGGRFLGHYVNFIRPPRASGPVWRLEDLVLDVWLPADGEPVVLDVEEWEEARAAGWIDAEEAERVQESCHVVLREAANGTWPPKAVRRWPLESVPYLRLRLAEPGRYLAALLAGRVIGYGLYLLGALSLTSLLFAAWPAITGRVPGHAAWIVGLGLQAVLLLPPALAGRLPATRWPRPVLSDERTLLLGAMAAGLAVLVLRDADEWRPLLIGVYGAVGLFCALFAACRAWFDRSLPLFALGGLVICLLALAVLFA
ncbi:MAG: DUF402 domain-containing protein [Gemmatimonadota bacterium]